MSKTMPLFPELKKPKQKPRKIMAHVRDVGVDAGLFECNKCGWSSGWLDVSDWTVTQAKRGVECENCNKVQR